MITYSKFILIIKMLLVYIVTIAFVLASTNCLNPSKFNEEIQNAGDTEIVETINKYFSKLKWLSYIQSEINNEDLLQAIHASNTIALVSRKAAMDLKMQHKAYLIVENNTNFVGNNIKNLKNEPTWNPHARFLIIIKCPVENNLKDIFDFLLMYHIDDVIVGFYNEKLTFYSYNSYANFACGKHYSIINYGPYSEAKNFDLYPYKYITGLQKCKLTAVITHWPPQTIVQYVTRSLPRYPIGVEPYLLQIISEKEGFQVEFIRIEGEGSYTAIQKTLAMLNSHKADMMLGGAMLIPARADAYDFAYGHSTYAEELRFLVKKSSSIPHWKLIYLVFEYDVWLLLLLCLTVYSILMIHLSQARDKTNVVFKLMKCLLLHGCNIQCRVEAKCVLIFWVWFAFLVNVIYQSNFVSLHRDPPNEYQVSTEEDLRKYRYKPCFTGEENNLYGDWSYVGELYKPKEGCDYMRESSDTVMDRNENLYTIFLYDLFKYGTHHFHDEYGHPRAYVFDKPFSKVIYVIYAYKGFPFVANISVDLLRLREMGLVDKALNDIYHLRSIQHFLRARDYETRFANPWLLYIVGNFAAVVVFILEIIISNTNTLYAFAN